MAELPSGTVTLLFTDIEGSTRLLHGLGERYASVLEEHRRLLRDAFSAHGGIEVDTQGDAFFYAFARAQDAVAGAVAGQRALSSHHFGEGVEVRVRMGIHTGEPAQTREGYVGPDVHLGSRICSVTWGQQIVVSSATAALISGLKELTLRPLGEHALKDIDGRVPLHQVVAPGLRDDFPALRSVDAHPTNLPRRLPVLIGREEDIAAVVELLASDEVSVVTLVGPGGTGKTQLSLAVAAQVLSSFSDGVFFVDLSALRYSSLVIPSVAQALSLRETSGRSLEESLADHLGSKEMLLVLDNFEHVMGAASHLSTLLEGASALKLVVTSREAVRISGERVVSVTPLGVPTEHSDVGEVASSPAVALFVARARAVRGDFTLGPDNAADVAAICRRLDGLPLALELAAARINLLSPSSLLSRLDQGLEVLSAGRRDASDRQRTLRGAIAWSYELLSEDEQRLFRRLGVFAGGWSLEAAEAVCDRGDLESDLLDGLASLVDKSLVFLSDSSTAPPRYEMLDMIRQFAQERCEAAGETEHLRHLHAEFHVALAERAEPQLGGAQQVTWFERLENEHDNLRTALGGLLSKGDVERALRLSGALWQFWRRQGYLYEGRMWLQNALSLARSGHERARAKALWGAGWLALVQGDYEEAQVLSDELMALSREHDEPLDERNALTILGMVLMARGRPREALEPFGRAIEACSTAGSVWHLAPSHLNLGIAKMHAGELADAAKLISTAHNIYTELGNDDFKARCVSYLGYIALLSDDDGRAESLFQESLQRFRDLGDRQGIAESMEGLAAVAAARNTLNDAVAAARLHGAAQSIREDLTARQYLFDRMGMDPFLERAKTTIGAAKWEQAWKQGRDLPVELAFELASTGEVANDTQTHT